VEIRGELMEYRAVIKKNDGRWIGWLVEVPGVNAQEKTRKKLLESLKISAKEMLALAVEPKEQEELVTIEV
jgi:predicted RNase H-like HicB family nuclease